MSAIDKLLDVVSDKEHVELIYKLEKEHAELLEALSIMRKEARAAVELIKYLPNYSGSDKSSEDFAVMHLIKGINTINRVFDKLDMPNNSNEAINKAKGRS